MSAFVVENATIKAIVNGIIDRNEYGHRTRDFLRYCNAPTVLGLVKSPQEFGQALFNLNREAVNGRYRENVAAPIYRHECGAFTNDVWLYKQIRCFLYQCSEDATGEHPLKLEMERVSDALAHQIVTSQPGYDAMPWGVSDDEMKAEPKVVSLMSMLKGASA